MISRNFCVIFPSITLTMINGNWINLIFFFFLTKTVRLLNQPRVILYQMFINSDSLAIKISQRIQKMNVQLQIHLLIHSCIADVNMNSHLDTCNELCFLNSHKIYKQDFRCMRFASISINIITLHCLTRNYERTESSVKYIY